MSDYEPKCKKTLPIIFDDRMPGSNLTPKLVGRVNNNTDDIKNLYEETETIQGDIESLQEDVDDKLDIPETAGTAGQVLTSDGEGGTVWASVGSGEIVVDPTLTVEGAAADAKKTGDEITHLKQDNNKLATADKIANGELDRNSIAVGTKTYKDIFVTGNLIPDGDFENGLAWVDTINGAPVISTDACCSKAHSLKCFGTASANIRTTVTVPAANVLVCMAKVRVDRYSAGYAGIQRDGVNYAVSAVTDGFVTAYGKATTLGQAVHYFFGTFTSANADAYIDDAVVLNLTTIFGEEANHPTDDELKALYENWIRIRSAESENEVYTSVERTETYVADQTRTLDSIAYGGKTYKEIFVDNNITPYGDFESGLDWISASTNNPVISTDACCSKSHSLKCFGTSSVQIRKDISYASSYTSATLCKVRVDRYVSGGGAGFAIGTNNFLVNHVTDGFRTLFAQLSHTAGTASNIFIGTISQANCDAYIDDFTMINLTAVFGDSSNFPSRSELEELYDNWIAIKNNVILELAEKIDTLDSRLDNLTDSKPIFVGALMGANSTSDRFSAMRQLYVVGQKVLNDPTYQTSDSDLTLANYGAVCVLPKHTTAMYENYNFDILYQKNGSTQAIPASTTKVMTLVTGLDYISDINERTTIVSDDIQDGSSSILQAGDIVTIKDLIYAMLLNSSNTAAMAFARVSGEKILTSQNGTGTYTAAQCQNAFIAELAVKAASIGMTNTSFVSPSGRSESNKTTVVDMLRFAIEACSYPIIQKIWNKKSYTIAVKGTNARNVDITTTVADAGFENDYYIFGGKTGTLSLNQTSIALLLVGEAK